MKLKTALTAATAALGLWFLPEIINPEIFSVEKLREKANTKTVQISRGKIEYEIRGEGSQTLLFIHGFSIPMTVWDDQISYFSNHGFRTVRYSQFGRGVSDYPKGVYDRSEYCRDALEMIDSLKITDAVLIGHSFGAVLASEIALARPDLAQAVVFVDPMLDRVTGNSGASISRTPLIGKKLARLVVSSGIESRAEALLAESGYHASAKIAESVETELKTKGVHSAVQSMFMSNALEDCSDRYALLEKQKIPLLILHTDPEKGAPADEMKRILALLPSAKKIYLPKASHLLQLAKPKEVNEAIESFTDSLKNL